MDRIVRPFSAISITIILVVLNSCGNGNDELNTPLISTAIVTSVTQTSAVTGGEITSDGGATVTARGVCWSTSQNPTISDSLTADGGGTGKFTSQLTGLTANTKYYVRAYATNAIGTAYGNEEIFSNDPPDVTDIDGHTYNVVRIGTQLWMRESLEVSRYRDGTAIPEVIDNTEWIRLTTGAYCNRDNDVANAARFGRLYNFYAVVDSRNLCPAGWHVPTDNEWKTLEMFLGMAQAEADGAHYWRGTDEGGKLKGTAWWNSPNVGATNESGFTALPSGWRDDSGLFQGGIIYGNWWSATENGAYTAWYRRLYYNYTTIFRDDLFKTYGYAVRCVKD